MFGAYWDGGGWGWRHVVGVYWAYGCWRWLEARVRRLLGLRLLEEQSLSRLSRSMLVSGRCCLTTTFLEVMHTACNCYTMWDRERSMHHVSGRFFFA